MIDEPCWDVNTEALRCLIVLDDGIAKLLIWLEMRDLIEIRSET